MRILSLAGGVINSIKHIDYFKNNESEVFSWINPFSLFQSLPTPYPAKASVPDYIKNFELDKKFEAYLSSEHFDRLVIESGIFSYDLYDLKGSLFTKSAQTEALKESANIVRTLELPERAIVEWVSIFATKIASVFRSDQIILISSKYNPYFSENDRILHIGSNPDLPFRNRYLTLVENTLLNIWKNCGFIDYSNKFLSSQRMDIRVASHNARYYNAALADLSTPQISLERTKTEIPESAKLDTFLRYKANSISSKFLWSILSEDLVFDQILRYSSDTFVKEFQDELQKMATLHNLDESSFLDHSMQFERHDFSRIVRDIIGVLNGTEAEYYPLLAKYNCRIIEIASEPLIKRFEQNGIIISPKDINYHNYQELSRLSTNMSTLASFMTKEEIRGKFILPIIPLHVDIWGSCYSRLIQNYNPTDMIVEKYLFQVNPLLVGEGPSNYPETIFPTMPTWEEKMLKIQLDGTITDFFAEKKCDWLLFDFYTLIGNRQAYFTDNKEIYDHLCDASKRLAKYLQRKQHYQLKDYAKIFAQMDILISYLKQLYGDKIIVLANRFAPDYIAKDGTIKSFDNDPLLTDWQEKQKFYDICLSYFLRHSDFYYIDIIKDFFADENTILTLSPTHFEEELYVEEAKIIFSIINNHKVKQPQKRFVTYRGDTKAARLLKLLEKNRYNKKFEEKFAFTSTQKFICEQDLHILKSHRKELAYIYDMKIEDIETVATLLEVKK